MAELPTVPKGKELEDFVAAILQTGGYYVEKDVIEQDVLELDVVATTYATGSPEKRLVEVKSGGWGFPDIFKLRGWMHYLGLPGGCLVTTNMPPKKDMLFYTKKAEGLGIKLILIDNLETADTVFRRAEFDTVADSSSMDIWRFSFWIERLLLRALRAARDSNPNLVGPKCALQYHALVNGGIFFVNDIRQKISKLYSAYRQHPRLTLGAAIETNGGAFDPDAKSTESRSFEESIRHNRHVVLQACKYIEHRARLSILKAAVDYLCYKRTGELPATRPRGIDLDQVLFRLLPDSFREGFNVLEKSPYFHLYPVFWQSFLWGWGGFLLEDRLDTEYERLATGTGLPKEEISKALELYSVFFPTTGGWFASVGDSPIKVFKMIPRPFRGVGAYRRLETCGFTEYAQFKIGRFAENILVGWHVAGLDVLEGRFQ